MPFAEALGAVGVAAVSGAGAVACDGGALDGELRLLYVAVTRVRERLFASYCQERERAGKVERRQPSRWLYALPPELLAVAA